MKLNELFNSGFDLNVVKDEQDKIQINCVIKDDEYSFLALLEKRPVGLKLIDVDVPDEATAWTIEFGLLEPGHEDPSYELTDKGNSIEVMGFVNRCVEELIKLRSPKLIEFSARGKRAQVYRRFFKRFSGYKLVEKERKEYSYFYLIDKQLTEAVDPTVYRGVRIYLHDVESSVGTHKFAFGQAKRSTKKLNAKKFQLLDPSDHKTVINKVTGERSNDWSRTQYWDYDGGLEDAKKAIDKLGAAGKLNEASLKQALASMIVGAAALGSVPHLPTDDYKRVQAAFEKHQVEGRETQKLINAMITKYKKLDPVVATKIALIAKKHGEQDFPTAADLLSVIGIESSFNPNAKSALKSDPALGLMQVRPKVWKLNPSELRDIEKGIAHGATILKKYYKRFGDKDKAIAAYNAGPGGVKRDPAAGERYLAKFEKERKIYK